MGFDLASFKNSRNYPRPATTTGTTDVATVNGSAGPISLIAAADPNRVVMTLRNLSTTDNMRYAYGTGGTPPTLAFLLSDGFILRPGEAFDIENPEAVYGISETVNPVSYNTDIGSG